MILCELERSKFETALLEFILPRQSGAISWMDTSSSARALYCGELLKRSRRFSVSIFSTSCSAAASIFSWPCCRNDEQQEEKGPEQRDDPEQWRKKEEKNACICCIFCCSIASFENINRPQMFSFFSFSYHGLLCLTALPFCFLHFSSSKFTFDSSISGTSIM